MCRRCRQGAACPALPCPAQSQARIPQPGWHRDSHGAVAREPAPSRHPGTWILPARQCQPVPHLGLPDPPSRAALQHCALTPGAHRGHQCPSLEPGLVTSPGAGQKAWVFPPACPPALPALSCPDPCCSTLALPREDEDNLDIIRTFLRNRPKVSMATSMRLCPCLLATLPAPIPRSQGAGGCAGPPLPTCLTPLLLSVHLSPPWLAGRG